LPVRAVLKTTGTTLLLILGGVVPFVGILSVLLSPLPLALLSSRESPINALPTLVVIGLLFTLIGGIWTGLITVIWFSCLGVLVGMLAKGERPFRKVVTLASTAAIFLVLVWVALLNLIGGLDLYGDGVESLQAALKVDSPILTELLTSEALEQIEESLPEISRQLPYLLPTLVIALVLASVVSVSAGLIRILERQTESSRRRIPPFVLWRVPWYLSWVFVLSLAALTVPGLVGAGVPEIDLLEGIGNGGLLLIGPFYLVQGGAIIVFHLSRITKSKALLGAVLAVLLVIPLLSQAVLFLGLFDTWFDLRRIEKGKDEGDSSKETPEGS